MRLPRNIHQLTVQSVRDFGHYVEKNHKTVSAQYFAKKLWELDKRYGQSPVTREVFSYEADMLADKLFALKRNDCVSIIMSLLCKTNKYCAPALEFFAGKGLDIAIINRDYVHMVARLNDLRTVYCNAPGQLHTYIRILEDEERCLLYITKSYDGAKHSFNTIGKKMAPKEKYEIMLAQVQLELAKLIKNKHPKTAFKKLASAERIFIKYNDRKTLDYISKLFHEINYNL